MAKNFFNVTVKNFSDKQIAAKVNKLLKEKQRSIQRKGPGLLRKSIQEILVQDPRTARFAGSLKNIPAESRSHSDPKIGSGIMMKVTGGKLNIRIRITPRLVKDSDTYYALMVAQYGRGPIRPVNAKVLALAVDNPYNGTRIPHSTKSGKFVVFAKYAGPVFPYYMWISKSQELAKRKFVDMIRNI